MKPECRASDLIWVKVLATWLRHILGANR